LLKQREEKRQSLLKQIKPTRCHLIDPWPYILTFKQHYRLKDTSEEVPFATESNPFNGPESVQPPLTMSETDLEEELRKYLLTTTTVATTTSTAGDSIGFNPPPYTKAMLLNGEDEGGETSSIHPPSFSPEPPGFAPENSPTSPDGISDEKIVTDKYEPQNNRVDLWEPEGKKKTTPQTNASGEETTADGDQGENEETEELGETAGSTPLLKAVGTIRVSTTKKPTTAFNKKDTKKPKKTSSSKAPANDGSES